MCKVSEVKKVPEIRFAGFAEPWEQRKLLDCIQKITDFRGRTPKKLGMDWSDSGYLALSALNVKDGYIDFSQDVHYGNQALYDKWMVGNELHEGQVLFTTEAPMGNVAQVPDNKRYILSQRTIAFDVRENVITENFLAAVLKSPAVFETLTALSSGGTAKGVSQKSLTAVDITLPRDLDEQSQLATVFSKINNLLTLYQRMLDRLVILKQAMLEKMFPQNGSNVPEVRFAGFTAPWEQRKFGEVFEEYSEKGHPELPALTIIQGGGTIRRDQSERSLQYDEASLYNYKMVNEGDFIVHLRSFEGGLEKATTLGIISPAYHTFHGKNTDSRFYYSYFRSATFINQDLKSHVYGIRDGRSIDIDGMKTIEIPWTDIKEQRAIGDYIDTLDNLISLHRRKHESLKRVKVALLHKMFV